MKPLRFLLTVSILLWILAFFFVDGKNPFFLLVYGTVILNVGSFTFGLYLGQRNR